MKPGDIRLNSATAGMTGFVLFYLYYRFNGAEAVYPRYAPLLRKWSLHPFMNTIEMQWFGFAMMGLAGFALFYAATHIILSAIGERVREETVYAVLAINAAAFTTLFIFAFLFLAVFSK